MAARARNAVRSCPGGVGALAFALLALPVACYPNPDDLRVNRSSSSGGMSGAVGGSNGSGGSRPGTGGALGAGGSAASAQCGMPACGGATVLGNWTFVSNCSSVSSSALDNCVGGTFDRSGVQRSGTLSFNTNGTFSSTETDTGSFIFDAPSACLNGGTCSTLQTAFQGPGYVGQPNPIYSSATCSATTTGCRCLLGALGTVMIVTGTYAVSGTSLTLTASTGGVFADTFCVTGSTLHIIYADSTISAPDEAVFIK